MFDKGEIVPKSNVEKKAENITSKYASIDELSDLFVAGILTMERIKQESEKLNINTSKLSLGIILNLKLNDSFVSYCMEIGNSSVTGFEDEKLFSGFFEKIQHTKKTPVKIEPVSEVEIIETIPGTQESAKEQALERIIQPVQEPVVEAEPALQQSQEPVIEENLFVGPKKPAIWEDEPIISTTPASQQQPEVEPAPITPEIILPAEPQKEIIKPEKKNWWEVKRETEVMAIEDLDGMMETFKLHVKKLGIAEKDPSNPFYWSWKGDNKKLVLLGDILGDRDMDGYAVSILVGDLSLQAEKMGGQVEFLCGNHEMRFINFLCGAFDDDYIERSKTEFRDESQGIWELAAHDTELSKLQPYSDEFKKKWKEFWKKLYNKMPEIIENMKTNPTSRYFLQTVCDIKVATIHDDTLFCHTDPTLEMINDLTRDGDISQRVDEINKIFQNNLREAIFKGIKFSYEFKRLEDIYLNTGNRDYFTVKDEASKLINIEKIRNCGINAILHGHSGNKKPYDENGFIVASVQDFSRGAAIIEKSGKIDFIGVSSKSKSLRDKMP